MNKILIIGRSNRAHKYHKKALDLLKLDYNQTSFLEINELLRKQKFSAIIFATKQKYFFKFLLKILQINFKGIIFIETPIKFIHLFATFISLFNRFEVVTMELGYCIGKKIKSDNLLFNSTSSFNNYRIIDKRFGKDHLFAILIGLLGYKELLKLLFFNRVQCKTKTKFLIFEELKNQKKNLKIQMSTNDRKNCEIAALTKLFKSYLITDLSVSFSRKLFNKIYIGYLIKLFVNISLKRNFRMKIKNKYKIGKISSGGGEVINNYLTRYNNSKVLFINSHHLSMRGLLNIYKSITYLLYIGLLEVWLL